VRGGVDPRQAALAALALARLRNLSEVGNIHNNKLGEASLHSNR
jgi:hypothetical protein